MRNSIISFLSLSPLMNTSPSLEGILPVCKTPTERQVLGWAHCQILRAFLISMAKREQREEVLI